MYSCRSFTEVHAVSELTFSVSQMLLPNLSSAASARLKVQPRGPASTGVQGVFSRCDGKSEAHSDAENARGHRALRFLGLEPVVGADGAVRHKS